MSERPSEPAGVRRRLCRSSTMRPVAIAVMLLRYTDVAETPSRDAKLAAELAAKVVKEAM